MRRVGFISTRISGTDGVSLETYKWYHILNRNDYLCFFFGGELDTPAEQSFLEPIAHFDHPEIREMHKDFFSVRTRKPSLSRRIQQIVKYLKERLYEYCKCFDIDVLIVENALAIPMHIPLGLAITEFIAETGIPTIAHHHDFSWERDRFIINSVQDYICYAFPPNLSFIRHAVINSSASRQLSFRRGISNDIIPNVFDFKNPPAPKNHSALALRKELGFDDDDIFVLQPTRVVPRKWIERAVEFVSLMDMSRPRLVVSHSIGDEGDYYARRIAEYARLRGVEIVFIGDMIGAAHCFGANHSMPYTMDDAYQAADIITYPSGYEGFGNAFLEAVYFKKPIVVNRYSIFIEDIEPLGFDVVAFESFVDKNLVERVKKFMEPNKLKESVEKNYLLGKKYFSYEVLERRLLHIMYSFIH